MRHIPGIGGATDGPLAWSSHQLGNEMGGVGGWGSQLCFLWMGTPPTHTKLIKRNSHGAAVGALASPVEPP